MSLFGTFEAKAEKIWASISGDAKRDLQQALADAKAEEAKILPVVTTFGEQLAQQVLTDLGPEAKAIGEQLLAQLLADLGGLLGEAPPPAPAAG